MAVLNRGSGHSQVGGHGPVAGGLAKAALPYLDAMTADAIQVYVSNPRGWATPPGDPAQDELFAAGVAERRASSWIHASLLVNLGSPTELTAERSAATLRHALRRAARIGASGVVFHAGSSVAPDRKAAALTQVGELLRPVLDLAGELGVPLLVEPSAGGGQSLASKMAHLGPYFAAVDSHEWLGVCLDTCHAHAAGHDLATEGGMTRTVDELVATVGPGRLRLIHANDSRDPAGSLRDRHTNIGAGTIGAAAFRELLAHPELAGVPLIVETPAAGHLSDIAQLRVAQHT